jgi:1,4-dihydroxy-2-naphthoyl-CoA hydrolase
VGASLWLADRGRTFGISNHTDFLRPVRRGRLRAEATPVSRGRTTQLWQVLVGDERGRTVAHGKVRLINLADTPGLEGSGEPGTGAPVDQGQGSGEPGTGAPVDRAP